MLCAEKCPHAGAVCRRRDHPGVRVHSPSTQTGGNEKRETAGWCLPPVGPYCCENPQQQRSTKPTCSAETHTLQDMALPSMRIREESCPSRDCLSFFTSTFCRKLAYSSAACFPRHEKTKNVQKMGVNNTAVQLYNEGGRCPTKRGFRTRTREGREKIEVELLSTRLSYMYRSGRWSALPCPNATTKIHN